ncbi:hypothetical protein OGAPHI_003690 [Ogataea philodendri]|uniref:Acyl-protein thioesterase 1 n=1 Tax=Ogataea philodendri TaxID=1378263 RepID=A0A9P8P6E2_9ASCO|nr:uncharacterized protein OGAPHI_003690 [Ogataea philodendri]KAH3665504.1 hypothetical protein OGAPHI_003690 [Ogataea philodendri]
MLSALRVSSSKPTATMVIIHGLGDSGEGWKFLSDIFQRQDQLKHINFVFPNAPLNPVSIAGGAQMPSWFDLYPPDDPTHPEDTVGFWKSADQIKQLIQKEIDSGIPSNRIIVGGFSQGAALSLAVAASSTTKLAGVLCLSGFCPVPSSLPGKVTDTNKSTPIFQAHGDEDPIIPLAQGRQTLELYRKLGFENIDFKEYAGMAHSSCPEELQDIIAFVRKTLP